MLGGAGGGHDRAAAWAFARCLASRLSGPEDEGALCVALETRLELAAAARLGGPVRARPDQGGE